MTGINVTHPNWVYTSEIGGGHIDTTNAGRANDLQDYMTLDLLESPVHVLTLQRASNQALMVLQDPPDYNEEERVMFRKEYNRNDPMGEQPDAWHTVKGEQDGFSLAVAARKSAAKDLRFGKFYVHEATYRDIYTGNTVKAKNRLLFATVQLKTWVTEKVLSRDSGASTDELPVVSAQMNFMCAKKKNLLQR